MEQNVAEIPQGNGTNGSKKKKLIALTIFGIFSLALVISIIFYMRYKESHVSTDDAFVEGRVHTIASKVPGTVKSVYVNDNQMVKKGDLLLDIDPSDYDIRMEESKSNLSVEQARLTEADARIVSSQRQLVEMKYRVSSSKANLDAATANLNQAETDLKRAEALLKDGAVTQEKYEKAKTGYDIAKAQISAAKELHEQAKASIEIQNAVIKQAEANVPTQKAIIGLRQAGLKAAELNRSYTKIHAPSDGFITRKSVQEGNQIQPGQPLLAVVNLKDIWVVANYKETDLDKIRPGQRVMIKVDAYPELSIEGRVDSIMSGTGSMFSLFPPENATGNFVKVVQRVPVKIIINTDSDTGRLLRVGMSVMPTVLVKEK